MMAGASAAPEDAPKPDLAAFVASRLCHDLVSPIGAIGNGVELLGMTGVAGPEIDLISQSVEGANARVRFFRVAFGTADPSQTVEGAQLASILASPHRGGKLVVSWQVDGPIARPEAKLTFLLLMCAESALVQGGEAAITRRNGHWRIAAKGRGIKADPALWSILTGGHGAAPAAGTIQFALAADCAAAIPVELAVDMGSDSLTILAERR